MANRDDNVSYPAGYFRSHTENISVDTVIVCTPLLAVLTPLSFSAFTKIHVIRELIPQQSTTFPKTP